MLSNENRIVSSESSERVYIYPLLCLVIFKRGDIFESRFSIVKPRLHRVQNAQLSRLHSCLRELNQIMNMLGKFPDKKLEILQFGIIIIPVLIRKF